MESLSRFRILFTVLMLILLPDFSWIADFPDAFFLPPPGPFSLLNGFPSPALFAAIEFGIALSLVGILIGWRTSLFSSSFTLLAIVGYGFSYSFGKINHNILLVILPLFLAYAGWGSGQSVDRLRGRTVSIRQWGIRLYALAIAMAFATAGLPKLRRGWLGLETQAVRAEVLRSEYLRGSDPIGTRILSNIDSTLFWELLDWGTVIFELAFGTLLIVSCFVIVGWWRLFRVLLGIAAIFHLAVLATFDISFSSNVIAYGAFVRWDRISLPAIGSAFRESFGETLAKFAAPVVVFGAIVTHIAAAPIAAVGLSLSNFIIWVGAGIGLGYLVTLARTKIFGGAERSE